MVQVLENKLVSLDVLPGTDRIEAQRQLHAHLAQGEDPAQAARAALQSASEKSTNIEGMDSAQPHEATGGAPPQIPAPVYGSMSGEDKETVEGTGAQIVDGTGKVLYTLGSTVGGVAKGVGDTVGNVMGDVAGGVGKVGTGAIGGLYDTAKAPFAGKEEPVGQAKGGAEQAARDEKDLSVDT